MFLTFKKQLSYLLLSVCCMLSISIHANDGVEIGGLIIDETTSRNGQAFYEYFYEAWENPEELQVSIRIIEKLSGVFGTFIWVEVYDTQVFQQRLSIRTADIEEMAKYAVYRTEQFLYQQSRMKKEFYRLPIMMI